MFKSNNNAVIWTNIKAPPTLTKYISYFKIIIPVNVLKAAGHINVTIIWKYIWNTIIILDFCYFKYSRDP